MTGVSVVIPAYNAEAFIERAINSSLNQNGAVSEVIVVDDGSTDSTAQKVLSFPNNVRLISVGANLGEAKALNRGFSEAKGKYVCWLSADDAFVNSEKTSIQLRAMQESNADWSYYRGKRSKTSRFIAHWFETDPAKRLMILMFFNPINGSSLMIRKDTFASIGGFPERKDTDADFDLWIRLTEAKFRMLAIGGDMVRLGIGPWQQSRRPGFAKICEDARLQKLATWKDSGELPGLIDRSKWFLLWLYSTQKHLRRPAVSRFLAEYMVQETGGLLNWVAKRSLPT